MAKKKTKKAVDNEINSFSKDLMALCKKYGISFHGRVTFWDNGNVTPNAFVLNILAGSSRISGTKELAIDRSLEYLVASCNGEKFEGVSITPHTERNYG